MVYACSDLHGEYGLWEKVKECLTEDDQLVFLGDAIDRGSRGWEIFTELLDDSRVYFLKGNHENYLYNCWFNHQAEDDPLYKEWMTNGGEPTLRQIQQIPKELADRYIERIRELPVVATYTNAQGSTFLLSHAGFTPDEYFYGSSKFHRCWSYIWDRNHIFDAWPEDKPDTYVVHGHTPAQEVIHEFGYKCGKDEAIVYADGHKIDIDLASYDTKKTALFNLDTLEMKTITLDNKEEN